MDLATTAQILGNFGEFLGSIGVLATLIYLSIQIRHGTQAARLNSSQIAIERYVALVESVNKDAETFAAFKRAIKDFAGSEPYQQAVFHSHVVSMVLATRHNEELFNAGTLSEDTFLEQKKDLARLLKTSGGREWMDALGLDPQSQPFKDVLQIGKDEPPLDVIIPHLRDPASD